MSGAAEQDGRRDGGRAEAKDEASGELIGSDLADATGDGTGAYGAVVDVGVVEVSLDGADGRTPRRERLRLLR